MPQFVLPLPPWSMIAEALGVRYVDLGLIDS